MSTLRCVVAEPRTYRTPAGAAPARRRSRTARIAVTPNGEVAPAGRQMDTQIRANLCDAESRPRVVQVSQTLPCPQA